MQSTSAAEHPKNHGFGQLDGQCITVAATEITEPEPSELLVLNVFFKYKEGTRLCQTNCRKSTSGSSCPGDSTTGLCTYCAIHSGAKGGHRSDSQRSVLVARGAKAPPPLHDITGGCLRLDRFRKRTLSRRFLPSNRDSCCCA